MTFLAKRCKAKSKSTQKRCRQPAVVGSDFCRMHGDIKSEPSNEEKPVGKAKGKEKEKQENPGAPRQNINALKHGMYSPRLLPDEEPIYEEKRKAFTEALGTVDVFDEQIIHLLTVISVKVDNALLRGAEHAAYGGMIKQILDLMKELKATRASRDRLTDGQGLTYADLFAAMKAHLGEAGNDDSGKAAGGSARKVIEHNCSLCGFLMEHKLEDDGRWRCQNCGHLIDIETKEEQRTPSGEADNEEEAVAESKQAGIA